MTQSFRDAFPSVQTASVIRPNSQYQSDNSKPAQVTASTLLLHQLIQLRIPTCLYLIVTDCIPPDCPRRLVGAYPPDSPI